MSPRCTSSPAAIRPLNVDVRLPLTLEKDKITLANARFRTPESQIVVSASMDHLVAPRTSAHLNAKVALDEIKRALGPRPAARYRARPALLTADVTGSMDNDRIQIQSARASLGRQRIEASGTLQDAGHAASVQFRSTLRWAKSARSSACPPAPKARVKIGGNAALEPDNEYRVTANLDARGVAIHQGATQHQRYQPRFGVEADPHRIELSGLRLAALGGGFTGSAAIQESGAIPARRQPAQFRHRGRWPAHSCPAAWATMASSPARSKPTATSAILAALVAKANLAIAPGLARHPRLRPFGCGLQRPRRHGQSGPFAPRAASHYRGVQRLAGQADSSPPGLAQPRRFSAGRGHSGHFHRQRRRHDRRHRDRQSQRAAQIAGQVAVTDFAVDGRPFTTLYRGARCVPILRHREPTQFSAADRSRRSSRRPRACTTGSRKTTIP